KMARTIESKV
nr:Chain B, Non-structural protein 1 [H5N1 subtype]7QTU_C Chain C, Non-structural protein 1 [H5N1 subtype]7QTU_D Chain D, Non-structural protein 1 [H5N1 subtype]7QTU_F Chain F, Non-structural protein 1 [H5N1 subtype]7QTU_H Chain H, Non-structural protein 1 [H5N1 subtype]